MQFEAAHNNRLMGQLPPLISEPNYDYTRDAAKLSARAQQLVANNPFAAALIQCELDNTHGPEGLSPVSLAQFDATAPVSPADHSARETIERAHRLWRASAFDATGQLSGKAFDRQLHWLANVCGDAFAIRVWKPGRKNNPFATAWRIIRPERVSNPDGKANSETLYHGLKLNSAGEIIGIYVDVTPDTGLNTYSHKRKHEYIPWYNDDGTVNVVHRHGLRIPGMLRSVSVFAPMLLLAKQLGGTIEAHVTGKRAQACNPVICYVDDPKEAAAAAGASSDSIVGPHTKFNPLQVYYAKFGYNIQFTNTNFNGTDLDAFLRIGFRVLCAVRQLPVEVVLCQMGEASLASARAGMDQVDRTAQGWQCDHIDEAANPVNASFISELNARDLLTSGPTGIASLAQFRYRRPPKYSTDRKKDGETITIWIKAGASPTSAFSAFGWDYEDETDQSIRDEVYKKNARAAAGLLEPQQNSETEKEAEPQPEDTTANPAAKTPVQFRLHRTDNNDIVVTEESA
jgi:capsid protein